MKLSLTADKVTIYGPKVDGGFTVKLDVGEYETNVISELVKIKTDDVVKVTLEQKTENSD